MKARRKFTMMLPHTIDYLYEDLQGHVSSANYDAVKKMIGREKVRMSCFVNGERFESEELDHKPTTKKLREFMNTTMQMVTEAM